MNTRTMANCHASIEAERAWPIRQAIDSILAIETDDMRWLREHSEAIHAAHADMLAERERGL
jgi:hypothetical protein